jgi:hypothetical protein
MDVCVNSASGKIREHVFKIAEWLAFATAAFAG